MGVLIPIATESEDDEKDFDPSQPRDADGRWSVGEAAGQLALPGMQQEHDASVDAERTRHALDDFSGSYKEDIEEAGSDAKRINAILDRYGGEQVEFNGNPSDLYAIGGDVMEWDGKSEPTVTEAEEFIRDADVDKYYPDFDQKFSDDLWSGVPGEVYHYTDEDNVESIMKNGLGTRDKTRGISNRGVGAAIFTSVDPEEMSDYGNARITINLAAMKKDGFMPFAEMEPEVADHEKRGALAHALGYDNWETDTEGGMSPNTVIFRDSIPPKYLKSEITGEYHHSR